MRCNIICVIIVFSLILFGIKYIDNRYLIFYYLFEICHTKKHIALIVFLVLIFVIFMVCMFSNEGYLSGIVGMILVSLLITALKTFKKWRKTESEK